VIKLQINSKNIIKKYLKENDNRVFCIKSKIRKSKSTLISLVKGEDLFISKDKGTTWSKALEWYFEYTPNKSILTFMVKKEIMLFKWSFAYWKKYKIYDYRLSKIDIEGKTFNNPDGTPNYKVENGDLYHYINNQWKITSKGNEWSCMINTKDGTINIVWSEKSSIYPNRKDIKYQKDLNVFDVTTA